MIKDAINFLNKISSELNAKGLRSKLYVDTDKETYILVADLPDKEANKMTDVAFDLLGDDFIKYEVLIVSFDFIKNYPIMIEDLSEVAENKNFAGQQHSQQGWGIVNSGGINKAIGFLQQKVTEFNSKGIKTKLYKGSDDDYWFVSDIQEDIGEKIVKKAREIAGEDYGYYDIVFSDFESINEYPIMIDDLSEVTENSNVRNQNKMKRIKINRPISNVLIKRLIAEKNKHINLEFDVFFIPNDTLYIVITKGYLSEKERQDIEQFFFDKTSYYYMVIFEEDAEAPDKFERQLIFSSYKSEFKDMDLTTDLLG